MFKCRDDTNSCTSVARVPENAATAMYAPSSTFSGNTFIVFGGVPAADVLSVAFGGAFSRAGNGASTSSQTSAAIAPAVVANGISDAGTTGLAKPREIVDFFFFARKNTAQNCAKPVAQLVSRGKP